MSKGLSPRWERPIQEQTGKPVTPPPSSFATIRQVGYKEGAVEDSVSQKPLHDLARAQKIASVLARYGFSEWVSRTPWGGASASPGESPGANDRLPAADRALKALQELGPTFVKLGQVLSSRPDILPREFLNAFETLQDRVPPFPSEMARRIIEEDLGRPIEDLFDEFQDEPLASASIAQVHAAVLRGGGRVAVKVQRPGIEAIIRSDISILYVLARALEGNLEMAGLYTPEAIVQEFDAAITRELDFHQEAGNAEAFARNLKELPGIRVPSVHRSLSSRRVLTLEFVDGVRLSHAAERGFDRQEVMDRLIAATYHQVFVDGLFHGDPHPGNLLVDGEGRLCYLDFGLVGRLTREMQDTLLELFTAVVFRDADRVARTLYRAGASGVRVNLRALSHEAGELLARYGHLSLSQQSTGDLIVDLLQAGSRHHLRLPQEFALLARATITLDGIARGMVPDWNMMEAVKPYALRLFRDRYGPDKVGQDLGHLGWQAAALLRDLPMQMDQLLLDLERGRLTLTAESPGVDRLEKTVARAGDRLLLGMGVSAFLVSAAILTVGASASDEFRWMSIVSAAAVVASLLAAGGLLGALLYNLYIVDRLKGLKLGRILGFFFRRDRS